MSETTDMDGIEFNVYPLGTNFKRVAGVYAFMKIENDTWVVLFVGETEDLKGRLSEALEYHHRYDCAVRRNGATHIATKSVTEGKKARVEMETRLREAFAPVCNQQ